MTKEEMWKEFENQLVRETRTPMTMSYDASEKMIKSAIKETVAKWKERLEQQPSNDCVEKLEQIEQIVARWNNDASHSFEDMCKINGILKE